ncbi:MAG TPA: sensor domain-containing protein [Solirubrobacter sp.]|nr:sensor domain-containing protein [Solirubrobacter sp.]
MLPAFDRTARDAGYLTLALLTSVLAFAVWVAALTVSLTLAVLIIGLPVIIGSAYALRWTAELDRRNAALVFGRPVRGHYHSHRGSSLGVRVLRTLRDPQVWRDLAWLITHSVVGFAFGVLAVTLIGTVVGLAVLPLWYWALPEGLQFGLWNADTLPVAIASAFLALPLGWVTVWLLRGMAKLHASLAVELLGRY